MQGGQFPAAFTLTSSLDLKENLELRQQAAGDKTEAASLP